MENKTNKTPIIIGISLAVIIICISMFALGYGGYQIYKNRIQVSEAQPSVVTDTPGPINESNQEESSEKPTLPDVSENSNNPDINSNLSDLFKAFWNARELLHENYLEQPINDQVLANGAIDGLETFLNENDLSLSDIELPDDAISSEEIGSFANTPEEVEDAFSPFWDAWNKLNYLDLPESTTDTNLMRHALTGMVAALDDPYTNYFDPDLAERWNTDLRGEYEGIGAWVDVDAEYLTIISPIKNTPAEEAGLRPGDQIIAIDGDDMTGVDPNIALKRVLGDAGTKVILTILRENVEEPFDVEITRRKITIPYIESEILEGDIAYIKLLRFYEGGDNDIRNELKTLLAENPKGLVFDLRGNPGGFLHTVVNITSEFMTDGNVLIEEFSDGSQKNYPIRNKQGIAVDIPLVVLVDEGSASASEIFAGAIKDYERGLLVGQTTFGKGLVQLPITLPDEQGLVSITIARWLTPLGITIHEIGVEPDFSVELTDADIEQELDPQLEKAIDLLTANQ